MTQTSTDVLKQIGGDHLLHVKSSTMAPKILAGDWAIVATERIPESGDTVVLKHENGAVSLSEYEGKGDTLGVVVGLLRSLK